MDERFLLYNSWKKYSYEKDIYKYIDFGSFYRYKL